MRALLFGVLIFSGIAMVLALASMMDGPRFSTISEYKDAWRVFRNSKSGQIWLIAHRIFLVVFLILSLDKFSIIALGG